MATSPPPPLEAGTRLFFVDHLRVALTTLVVLHHLAIMYAANMPFYYEEPAYRDARAAMVLVVFQLLNQAHFMGFFFLLSGYLTPGSFHRKGPTRFLVERFRRLGIPLVVYALVLNPIAWVGVYRMPRELTHITTPFTWQQYPKLIAMGPMWFVAMLLIIDVGYVAWRLATKNRPLRPKCDSTLPPYRLIGAAVLGTGISKLPCPHCAATGSFGARLPEPCLFSAVPELLYHWCRRLPSRLVSQHAELDGQGGVCACDRLNTGTAPACAQRQSQLLGPRTLGVRDLRALGFHLLVRHLFRTDCLLPSLPQPSGTVRTVPDSTGLYGLRHPHSGHRVSRPGAAQHRAGTPAQIQPGGDHRRSALFRCRVSGPKSATSVPDLLTAARLDGPARGRNSQVAVRRFGESRKTIGDYIRESLSLPICKKIR